MKRTSLFRSFFMAALLFTSSFAFTSCEEDDDIAPVIEDTKVRGPYDQKGVFILNEGNYGTPNGSISFLSDSTDHQVKNDIFGKANEDRPLGDVIQSMLLHDTLAYIVANNSNKIEVVHAFTFKTVAVVENLKQPRYFVALNGNKGYVTETVSYSSNGQVSVIDLKTNKVIKTLPVGAQPEQLLLYNGKLYVANNGGNTLTIINTATDAVEGTIETPDGPQALTLDKNNMLWVLSNGKIVYKADWSGVDYTKTTAGALSQLNPANGTIVKTLPVASNQSAPGNLAANGVKDKLYYTYSGKTYELNITATALPTTALIERSFKGLG
ncbi:MAG TPA: YncE family protein, partial [Pontibacter sp.]